MPQVEKTILLYEGKAKNVFATGDDSLCILSYRDDTEAYGGLQSGWHLCKAEINNRVTNHIMRMLEARGIPTHYVAELSNRETLVRKVTIVPLEVVIRNIASGSLAARLGLPIGHPLAQTVLEFCYKNDALGDPMVNEYHILAMQYATLEDLARISDYALRINDILTGYFTGLGIVLVDFKLEFGKTADGQIVLADEISPDTCLFWRKGANPGLDGRFVHDPKHADGAYEEIIHRVLRV